MTAPVPINTKKLRTIAEAALNDSELAWTYVDGPLLGGVHVETRPEHPGRSRIRVDPNAVGPFIAAASPGTVLALLDEIDGSRAPEAHWECQQKIDVLEEQLAAAIVARVEARRDLDEALDLFDAVWCPEHGHAPKPEQLARAEELRKLVPR